MSTAFELVRIFAYFVITCTGAYLYFDDEARGRGSRFVWLAFGVEHVVMLFFLAMDLQELIAFVDGSAFWIFTPVASYVALATLVSAALSILGYAVWRYLDRRRATKMLASMGED